MMDFIKKNRRFVLTMVVMVAIIAVLGLKIGQQANDIETQKENIVRLEAEVPLKKAEKQAALKEQKAAEKLYDAANKAKKKAKTAADKLAKTLDGINQELQQNEAAQAESLAALNNVLTMLSQQDVPVDQEQLLAELETALTALGGTMPGADVVEEGTEK